MCVTALLCGWWDLSQVVLGAANITFSLSLSFCCLRSHFYSFCVFTSCFIAAAVWIWCLHIHLFHSKWFLYFAWESLLLRVVHYFMYTSVDGHQRARSLSNNSLVCDVQCSPILHMIIPFATLSHMLSFFSWFLVFKSAIGDSLIFTILPASVRLLLHLIYLCIISPASTCHLVIQRVLAHMKVREWALHYVNTSRFMFLGTSYIGFFSALSSVIKSTSVIVLLYSGFCFLRRLCT